MTAHVRVGTASHHRDADTYRDYGPVRIPSATGLRLGQFACESRYAVGDEFWLAEEVEVTSIDGVGRP